MSDVNTIRRVIETALSGDGSVESVLAGASLREFSSLLEFRDWIIPGDIQNGAEVSYNDYLWVVSENVASVRVSVFRKSGTMSSSFAMNFLKMGEQGWRIAAVDRIYS